MRAAVRVGGCILLLISAACGRAPSRQQVGSATEQDRPFAEVRSVERVRLTEAIPVAVYGQKNYVTDFLLLHIIRVDGSLLLGGAAGPVQLMLGELPTRVLWVETGIFLLVPAPREPLSSVRLWAGPYTAEMMAFSKEGIQALKAQALAA
jgi:hypothetical protein